MNRVDLADLLRTLGVCTVIGLSVFVLCLLMGCMSDREYQLRRQQLRNQAAHPTTYEPLSFELSGPIKIELIDGAQMKARVTAPNQPFREVPIPDGIKSQTDLVKHLMNVGAISVLGWKAIDGAKGETTINNAPAETPAATP